MGALGRALKEELILTSTWSVVPWQPKFRALCVVEHFLKKGGSWRSVALSAHHAHALFHCMMQVPECTQKASQVMTACNTPEKAEPKAQLVVGEAADATTAGVQSTEDKETKIKTGEEAEGENAEAPEKCLEDLIQDTEEEEQVADAATAGVQSAQDKETESKTEEKAGDVATAGVQSTQNKETESKTAEKAEGETEESEKEHSEERNFEAPKKLIEDDTIKRIEEESKSLHGELKA